MTSSNTNSLQYFHEKVAEQQMPQAYAAMISKEYDKAFAIYQTFAENRKSRCSISMLAYLYQNGLGVTKDPVRACVCLV